MADSSSLPVSTDTTVDIVESLPPTKKAKTVKKPLPAALSKLNIKDYKAVTCVDETLTKTVLGIEVGATCTMAYSVTINDIT